MQQQIIQTNIDSTTHDGRGIASIKGKKVFLTNALAGEKVNFVYTRKRSNYDEGKVIEILKASPDRVTPKCPHFSVCGGCSLQHMRHAAQLQLKQQVLLEQLQHFGGVQPQEILPPITGDIWHYRTKARLGVKYVQKKNKVLVGFHEKNGRYIADIESCAILHESIGNKITALGNLIAQLSNYQHIPQIEIAVGDNKTALVFRHLQDFSDQDKKLLLDFATQNNNLQIYLQPKGLNSIHCLTDKPASCLSYTLAQQNLELFFHVTDFTQINQGVNQKMVSKVLELLAIQAQDAILDLFCGIGNFTLPLAQCCAKVIGVEANANAVECAKENTTHNNIKNANFFNYDLNKDITGIGHWIKQKFDKILLDPPRTGALNVVQQIAQFAAQKIVYVSCNPATLARDAKELTTAQGYQLTKAGIIDMFPHTSHAETIALFEKN